MVFDYELFISQINSFPPKSWYGLSSSMIWAILSQIFNYNVLHSFLMIDYYFFHKKLSYFSQVLYSAIFERSKEIG